MSADPHLFRSKPGAARRFERATFGLFRAATYLVLACGLAVFGTIVWRGAPTVFRAEFPFVNTSFLTEAPESLHVFEFEGKNYELGDRARRAFVAAHPAAAQVKTASFV
ncbi:MAG: hypothetical protein RLZZ15_4217, partial [Verrucomicrobiota bacterium]